jgi:hypothetical protein
MQINFSQCFDISYFGSIVLGGLLILPAVCMHAVEQDQLLLYYCGLAVGHAFHVC